MGEQGTEKSRSDLLKYLQERVNLLYGVLAESGDDFIFTEEYLAVRSLIGVIERCLRFSLKKRVRLVLDKHVYSDYFTWLDQGMREAGDPSDINVMYKIKKDITLRNSTARGTAWIKWALIRRNLSAKLEKVSHSTEALSTWYYESSIMRNAEDFSRLLSVIQSLSAFEFDLDITNSAMNEVPEYWEKLEAVDSEGRRFSPSEDSQDSNTKKDSPTSKTPIISTRSLFASSQNLFSNLNISSSIPQALLISNAREDSKERKAEGSEQESIVVRRNRKARRAVVNSTISQSDIPTRASMTRSTSAQVLPIDENRLQKVAARKVQNIRKSGGIKRRSSVDMDSSGSSGKELPTEGTMRMGGESPLLEEAPEADQELKDEVVTVTKSSPSNGITESPSKGVEGEERDAEFVGVFEDDFIGAEDRIEEKGEEETSSQDISREDSAESIDFMRQSMPNAEIDEKPPAKLEEPDEEKERSETSPRGETSDGEYDFLLAGGVTKANSLLNVELKAEQEGTSAVEGFSSSVGDIILDNVVSQETSTGATEDVSVECISVQEGALATEKAPTKESAEPESLGQGNRQSFGEFEVRSNSYVKEMDGMLRKDSLSGLDLTIAEDMGNEQNLNLNLTLTEKEKEQKEVDLFAVNKNSNESLPSSESQSNSLLSTIEKEEEFALGGVGVESDTRDEGHSAPGKGIFEVMIEENRNQKVTEDTTREEVGDSLYLDLSESSMFGSDSPLEAEESKGREEPEEASIHLFRSRSPTQRSEIADVPQFQFPTFREVEEGIFGSDMQDEEFVSSLSRSLQNDTRIGDDKFRRTQTVTAEAVAITQSDENIIRGVNGSKEVESADMVTSVETGGDRVPESPVPVRDTGMKETTEEPSRAVKWFVPSSESVSREASPSFRENAEIIPNSVESPSHYPPEEGEGFTQSERDVGFMGVIDTSGSTSASTSLSSSVFPSEKNTPEAITPITPENTPYVYAVAHTAIVREPTPSPNTMYNSVSSRLADKGVNAEQDEEVRERGEMRQRFEKKSGRIYNESRIVDSNPPRNQIGSNDEGVERAIVIIGGIADSSTEGEGVFSLDIKELEDDIDSMTDIESLAGNSTDRKAYDDGSEVNTASTVVSDADDMAYRSRRDENTKRVGISAKDFPLARIDYRSAGNLVIRDKYESEDTAEPHEGQNTHDPEDESGNSWSTPEGEVGKPVKLKLKTQKKGLMNLLRKGMPRAMVEEEDHSEEQVQVQIQEPEDASLPDEEAETKTEETSQTSYSYSNSYSPEVVSKEVNFEPPVAKIVTDLITRRNSNSRIINCRFCNIEVSGSAARYCNYFGYFSCIGCMSETKSDIPSRVLHKWDFKLLHVSKMAKELMEESENQPLYDIQEINPALYDKNKSLALCQQLRYRIGLMRDYIFSCKHSPELQKPFRKRIHLLYGESFFSMNDLREIKSGALKDFLSKQVNDLERHITEECDLCRAKGHSCLICKSDEVLFPFLGGVKSCPTCRHIFHSKCFSSPDECSICKMRERRK